MAESDTQASPPPPAFDVTALEVDPSKGERFYKAAIVHSKQGTTYRMVAKVLPDGRLDLVYFVCDLGNDGTMLGKRRVRRIESQPDSRFDKEIEAIKNEIRGNTEEIQGEWVLNLTTIQDISEQASSINTWMKTTAKEIRPV